MTLRLVNELKTSTAGNFGMVMALLMIPLALVAGLAVDYTQGTQTRAGMQNALDAAAFAALALPITATDEERQIALEAAYTANSGQGTAIAGPLVRNGDMISLKASADYAMPTNFMKLIQRNEIPVSVNSTVTKRQQLLTAKFRVNDVTGYWDKKITLFGQETGQTGFTALLEIDYKFNGVEGIGHGTTTIRKAVNGAMTNVFRRTCQGDTTNCTDTILSGDGKPEVDVSKLEQAYLQMDISASYQVAQYWLDQINPVRPLRTNDKKNSDHVFINEIQQPKNKTIDILRMVDCGQWSEQAWEDGGGGKPGQTPYQATDFKYDVQGICGWKPDDKSAYLSQ